ncbi:MAG TPA: glycosyltransferase [Gemmatimonadaceae bacterium]
MRLVVVSHKVCWPSAESPTGYATDGGFAFQMRALSELFDATTLVVPCNPSSARSGEIPLSGHALSVVPLTVPTGRELMRKLRLPGWLLRNIPVLTREIRRADAVHAPIPGDIGTIGLLLAMALGKPLFVRHCGNWFEQRTVAEHFWKWLLERCAGGKNVVLTTGGAPTPPSARNPHVRWIFSTSLTEGELRECATPRTTLPHAGPRLIIVCRQDPEKGTGVVIESLPRLAEQFPDVRFDVVGDGPALDDFKALAASLGVADRVVFHGRVNHDGVVSLLRQADVFCYPTAASEGFPKVVLEAIACGLPVVTTRVSVLAQLIGGGGGVLVDRADAEHVADAVRWCLADASRYSAMSTAAIHTAREYSLERWRDAIGGFLSSGWGPLRTHA